MSKQLLMNLLGKLFWISLTELLELLLQVEDI